MDAPTPPPIPLGQHPSAGRDPRAVDAGHLRLLWIFHCALAACTVMIAGVFYLQFTFTSNPFGNTPIWPGGRGTQPPMPAEVLTVMRWVLLVLGLLLFGLMVLNLLSAWCIAQRKVRVFSMVVAGLDCLLIPYGTVLGVFTLMVLGRDSVRHAYAEAARPGTPLG